MPPNPIKTKPDDNLEEQEDFTINQLEDTEMEVEENLGYVPLQQDFIDLPANDSTDEDDEDSDNEMQQEYTFHENNQQPPPSNVPEIISSSAELEANLWNTPRRSSKDLEVTKESSQQIIQIMSKINLPNAPAWITEISTETLISKLKNHQQKPNGSDCKK